MPAVMTINQAGLPAGVADKARTDGLATGALVTLTSVGGGTTHTFRLLWVPLGDTTAVSTLVQTGPTTWTFSPTALRYGSYRIELVVDEGLPTESRSIRIFGIRLPTSSLLIPAMNQRGDPRASLENDGAAVVSASEDNENKTTPGTPFASGNYGSWYPDLEELFNYVETLSGGGGSPNAFVLATNALNDDVLNGEKVLGGLLFLPVGSTFEWQVVCIPVGGNPGPGPYIDIRLYDMGQPNIPAVPVLRSSTANLVDGYRTIAKTLTPVAVPGVNIDEISTGQRVYELRASITGPGVPGVTSVLVLWSGIRVT